MENIFEQGENACNKHFLSLFKAFSKASFINLYFSIGGEPLSRPQNVSESNCEKQVHSSLNNLILGLSKSKAFADDIMKVIVNLKFVLLKVENIVGKGENAGYQHFLLFLQCFLKASFSGSSKVGIVW